MGLALSSSGVQPARAGREYPAGSASFSFIQIMSFSNPIQSLAPRLRGFKNDLTTVLASRKHCRAGLRELYREIRSAEEELDSTRQQLVRLGQPPAGPQDRGGHGGPARVVSRECAEHLAARLLAGAFRFGKLQGISETLRCGLDARVNLILGVEERAALGGSDAPLPVEYQSEIVRLVESYGAIRRWGTVYPLAAYNTWLPRLKTSPAFEFIDLSATVPEKSPQIEFVKFAPEKAGGLVRIPAEIEEDSVVNLGNFLAEWIARQMSLFEDDLAFNADGTSGYALFTGVLKHALDESRAVTLAAGVSAPPEITLEDVRAMRRHVASAALVNGAYYFNPTYEALFCSFNDDTDQGEVFVRGANGDTLDDYPVRWVSALPVYDTADDAEKLVGGFGDLSFAHLGERGPLRIDTSRAVYFHVDQIALRVISRLAFGQMADDSMAALQLGPAE
jgi:HK97 family phage major capsid protein